MADTSPQQVGYSGLGVILGAVVLALVLLYLMFAPGGADEPNFVAPAAASEAPAD